MKIPFVKYHGAGNDFIIIDNRKGDSPVTDSIINQMCHRRFGIGADGLMLLGSPVSPELGFSMRYFNADGPEGTMCGNGGRCIVAFAWHCGIRNLNFTAIDGPHSATVLEDKGNTLSIRLKMKDVDLPEKYQEDKWYLNTGSPHLMVPVTDLEHYDVDGQGRYWRYHPDFPKGLNVNFVEQLREGRIHVRTFERGVEAETWACGTGATASAITAGYLCGNSCTHWEVEMAGGLLKVDYKAIENGYRDIYLSGPACRVFEGEFEI